MKCRKCGVELTEENRYPSDSKRNCKICKSCRNLDARKTVKEWIKNHRDKWNKYMRGKMREYNRKIRVKVLIHYGGNPPKCACCGESHEEFLCIDHIHGGGNKHKKSIGGGFYRWLVKNDFPEGYRVLCHNCNCSRGFYGYCPHTTNL